MSAAVALAEERPTLAVRPLSAGEDSAEDAAHLTSLLRVSLVNEGAFQLLSEAEPPADAQPADTPRAEAPPEATYLLTGRVSDGDGEFRISVELTSVSTRATVYAAERVVTPSRMRTAARKLAEEISRVGRSTARLELADIDALIEIDRYEDALGLVERYASYHPDDDRAERRRRVIAEALAEHRYEQAQEYASSFLYDDAIAAMEDAIARDPESSLYRHYRAELVEERAALATQSNDQLFAVAEEFLAEQRYDSAQSVLEVLGNRGAEETRVSRLAGEIRRGQREERYVERAQTALWSGNYAEARTAITQALEMNPENSEYRDLLATVNAQEARLEESRETWQRYRTQARNADYLSLLTTSRLPRPSGTVYWGLAERYRYRERSTLDAEALALRSATAEVRWPRVLSFEAEALSGLEFLSPFWFPFGSLAVRWGSEESELTNAEGRTVLAQDRTFVADLSAGAGTGVQALSFSLALGLEGTTGVTRRALVSRVVVADETSREAVWATLSGLGLNFWLNWLPSDRVEVSLKYRHAWLWPSARQLDQEQIRTSLVALGVGYAPAW